MIPEYVIETPEQIWVRQRREREQRDAQEKIEQWWSAKSRMESKLQARRREQRAKAPPLVTSGPGWHVVAHPKVPHEMLEGLARNLLSASFHGLPNVLEGWRFRWGVLSPSGLNLVVGLCSLPNKIILIDESLSLAEPGPQARKMLVETLAHECAHALCPHGTGHAELFQRVLKSINAIVLDDAEAAAPPAALATSRFDPPKGVTPSGRTVTWPGAGEWEFR